MCTAAAARAACSLLAPTALPAGALAAQKSMVAAEPARWRHRGREDGRGMRQTPAPAFLRFVLTPA